MRDLVPLPGAPAASALTDPGEGHRQDPAPPGAPAPRGSGKGEGRGTRAKGGPNGTGRAALAGQRQLPGPTVLSANRKAGRAAGSERDFRRCGRGAKRVPQTPASISARESRCGCRGSLAFGAQAPRASLLLSRSSLAAPRLSAACVGLKGASALKVLVSPSRLGMWTRRVGPRKWREGSLPPSLFGCWCFPGICILRNLLRADYSQISFARPDSSLELQGQLPRRHLQLVVQC